MKKRKKRKDLRKDVLCFRCHPEVAHLCGQLFYGGRLESGISREERSSALGYGVAPLAVVLSEGLETRVGQSYRHDAEARALNSAF